jgi:hypothetical protein
MSGNVKFRWFLLAPIVVALLVVTSPMRLKLPRKGDKLV